MFSKWLGCLKKKICYERILELDFAKNCFFFWICVPLKKCCIIKHHSTSNSFIEVGVILHELCKSIHTRGLLGLHLKFNNPTVDTTPHYFHSTCDKKEGLILSNVIIESNVHNEHSILIDW